MSSKPGRTNIYALTWRLPIIFWQLIFFVGPVLFMLAMSFFLVKNYRMTEAFEFVNWSKMLSRGYFWDSYWYTVLIASASTACAMCIAFPAAYTLAFRASENTRRWAVFLLIIPFFTSYLVRTFSWFVILSESGVVNAMLGLITPPYGLLLFIVSSITKEPLMNIVRELIPFLIALMIALGVITFVPDFVLWLPRLLGYKG